MSPHTILRFNACYIGLFEGRHMISLPRPQLSEGRELCGAVLGESLSNAPLPGSFVACRRAGEVVVIERQVRFVKKRRRRS